MIFSIASVFLHFAAFPQDSCPISEFLQLQNNIRESRISKDSAICAFKLIVERLDAYYRDYGAEPSPKSDWQFPVEGYFHRAIGGNGNGYRPYGFDFFQKTRHNPHPAHDIFINDKNQDALDDGDHAPVNVISISSGVVVDVRSEWSDTSLNRGGKYVWIYDSANRRFFYYAHLRRTFVEAGECVSSGMPIGEVGRTGYNAFKRRSPTHLHLMVLQIGANGLPKPINPYHELRKMKTR